jgi:3-hydroxyisobutyrate dehydrogenase/glyoxylate/succinic semialdehyde reductase
VAPAFLGKVSKIKTRDYSPQFPLHLMNKDLNLAAAAALQSGAELPVAQATRQVFEEVTRELRGLDISAIASYVLTLADEPQRVR